MVYTIFSTAFALLVIFRRAAAARRLCQHAPTCSAPAAGWAGARSRRSACSPTAAAAAALPPALPPPAGRTPAISASTRPEPACRPAPRPGPTPRSRRARLRCGGAGECRSSAQPIALTPKGGVPCLASASSPWRCASTSCPTNLAPSQRHLLLPRLPPSRPTRRPWALMAASRRRSSRPPPPTRTPGLPASASTCSTTSRCCTAWRCSSCGAPAWHAPITLLGARPHARAACATLPPGRSCCRAPGADAEPALDIPLPRHASSSDWVLRRTVARRASWHHNAPLAPARRSSDWVLENIVEHDGTKLPPWVGGPGCRVGSGGSLASIHPAGSRLHSSCCLLLPAHAASYRHLTYTERTAPFSSPPGLGQLPQLPPRPRRLLHAARGGAQAPALQRRPAHPGG